MKRIASWLLLAAMLPATAQNVTYNGSMGDRALLVIDGQAKVLTAGQSFGGVKVDSVAPEEAHVHVNGRGVVLRQGTPVNLGGGGGGAEGQEIILSAGPGGHFRTAGMINHKPVQFLVDTGATNISMSAADAERLGVDYRQGQLTHASTANGVVNVYITTLNSVRIGDVEVYNVYATVHETPMEFMLLGNSFLSHFDMQRVGDTLKLTKKF
jgi:aspartyl protease family protein